MKQQLKPLVIGLGLIGFISSSAFADDNRQMMLALQQQIASLQQEVYAMKNQTTTSTVTHKQSVPAKKQQAARKKSTASTNANGTPVTLNSAEVAAEKADAKAPATGIYGPDNLPLSGLTYLPIDMDVPGQSFVSTGPYLGVPLSYSGSNLIINTPSINEDVSLLKMRKNVNQRMESLGVQHPEDHSHLLFSGAVEGQAYYKERGHMSNTSDIDVTNAELDAYILGPSSWTSGLLAFNYENDLGSQTGSISSNHRTANSRLFVSKAFITIGDFMRSPLYGSIGQMFVPFGTYSSSLITSPMTKTIFRTKARAIVLGYQQQAKNAFYSSLFIFRGDTHVGSSSRIDNGGVNVGYKYDVGAVSGNIGAGVLGNIADSDGMQLTFNKPSFAGFGSSSTTCGASGTQACGNEQIVHNVPGYDMRGTISFGNWDLLAEYLVASTSFNPNDMTFNSHGAKPQALDAEAAYTFVTFGDKPTSVVVGYGMSKQALALGLPQTRYSLALNTSWWHNTLQSLEFRHDLNYSSGSTASGSNVAAAPGNGYSNNTVTAQIDIYF